MHLVCILGLVLCPFGYIALGALSGFAPGFAYRTLPPLLASVGFLLYRFLSKPRAEAADAMLIVIEVVGWILIAAFLALVSSFNLATLFEQIGLTATFFLAASGISLLVVLLRSTAVQQRLKRFPTFAIGLLLLVLVVLAAVATGAYFLRAPAFIG